MQNDYLLELIGKSFNAKVQHDAQKYMKEQQMKFFDGHMPTLKETAFIVAHKDGEIKSLGASCVDDLILDNFGKILAGFIKTPDVGTFPVTSIIDDANTAFALRLYGPNGQLSFSNTSLALGTLFKMGSGITPPARTDYKIETNLANAPESGYINTGVGGWNSALGKVTSAQTIITGGNGTVKESGIFWQLVDYGAGTATKKGMIAHDAISPTVDYLIGQNLTCQYVFNL